LGDDDSSISSSSDKNGFESDDEQDSSDEDDDNEVDDNDGFEENENLDINEDEEDLVPTELTPEEFNIIDERIAKLPKNSVYDKAQKYST
jgi:hypothetical protein